MTPEEFWKILYDIPKIEPVLFRVYYDDHGHIIEYTHEDKPGKYIDVDPETFRIATRNARVINNQLIQVCTTVTKKLYPNAVSGTCCHPQDVCVVVGANKPNIKWKLKTHEQN